MDYQIAFYVLVAFLAGRYLPRKIYVGYDRAKFDAADAGILLRK